MNNDELIALERELAELLGFTCIEVEKFVIGDCLYGTPQNASPDDEHILPQWARDDAAAFQLQVEHCVNVTYCEDWGVSTYIDGNCQGYHCDYSDFASKAEALRASIAKSVTSKLLRIKTEGT